MLDVEHFEYVINYESDTISLSSRGTRYSGFTSINGECTGGINCSHSDPNYSNANFIDFCTHFRAYDGGMKRTHYDGGMRLGSDMWYMEDLIFEDDHCFACDYNQCDLINLRCGCTYHKSCIRRYLEKGREECPGCHPDVCQACIDCSY